MKAILSFVLLSFLTFTSYGEEAIKVGVRSYYPPFEMVLNQKKQVSGFEVAIITEVCKRLKRECIFVPLKFDDLFTAIESEKISLAIGAIIITEVRQGGYLFSLPYLASDGQFITKSTNQIDSIPGLCSKKIGLVKGSIFKSLLIYHCHDKAEIVEFPVVLDAYNGLRSEDIDAVITDEKGARYWVANNNNLYKLVGSSIPTGLGYAIMANLKENLLIDEINKALLAMQSDGAYLNIYHLYFGPDK